MAKLKLVEVEEKDVCRNYGCGNKTKSKQKLCSRCRLEGYKVDYTNNPDGVLISPKPDAGDKYFYGYPLYRCQYCGQIGGH